MIPLQKQHAPQWMLEREKQDERAAVSSAFFSLAMTQRRLAHSYKRDALKAKALGNDKRFEEFRQKSDRLWNDAKKHFSYARSWRQA
ncbi:hypothetical protein [Chelativorans sp. Marseille-P2723]|uniref:hypothetical protein n=1 Tax=Chelativorans sp. Marseille-P2723 TaxID=2709133 RepID=UPI0015700CA3|nr:hypothetical protein [Chelativorans sp. Marseille-P2723]